MMHPMRASKLSSPPPVIDTITVRKRIQIQLPQPGTAPVPITVSSLMAGVPGGSTYWGRVRIERLDVWSDFKIPTEGATSTTNTDTLTVAIPPGGVSPATEWTDTGVPGQRRAHIGFRLGLMKRAEYNITANSTILCYAGMDTEDAFMIVQATVELTSPVLS